MVVCDWVVEHEPSRPPASNFPRPQLLHCELRRHNHFIMDEKLVDDAVDGNESYQKPPQEFTSFAKELSLVRGEEHARVCSTCQTWADALPGYILGYDDQDRINLIPPPFHPNVLSMIQSARVGCPFCFFVLEKMERPHGPV